MQFSELSPHCNSEAQKDVVRSICSGNTYAMTAELLGVSNGTVAGIMKRVKRRFADAQRKQVKEKPKDDGTVSKTVEGKGDNQHVDYRTTERIETIDQAIAKAEIDTETWEVERFLINSWEVGAKGPDGRILVTPLWQVKIWLQKKQGWSPAEFRKLLVEDIKAEAKAPTPVLYASAPTNVLAELSIFDAHFGKLAWAPETGGQDYDVRICVERYMSAAYDLVDRCLRENPERFLYVVGNDFFHADHKGATTSGTIIDCDGRWQRAFRYGRQCCVEVINHIANHCPVDVMCVQGNHDQEKVFCLGEVLDAQFSNDDRVEVLNEPDVYSYYKWGANLLGFVHGENHGSKAKRAELPVQLMEDNRHRMSDVKWMEWHLGHFHSEQEDVWKYRKVEHVRDVAVRVLPSLSSTDSWHRQSGYASVLAAEAFVYDKELGRRDIKSYLTDGKRPSTM